MLEKQRIKHKQECQIEGKKEKQQVRNVRCAAVQMRCSRNVAENIEKAEVLVRQAAAEGAQVILLPELFERQYFCQERRYDYYQFATPVMENPAVRYFQGVCASLQVVIPISFYERDVNRLFNSVAMIDADGSILGVYRKTHIPDDHFYQEKFYFTPGDTGFRVFDTRYGKIGVGICWDQWFPETARAMAVEGAEILLYPTAIGSEPILSTDSMPHWRRCMQGHSASTRSSPTRFGACGCSEPGRRGTGRAMCRKCRPEFFPGILRIIFYHRRLWRGTGIHGKTGRRFYRSYL